MKKIIGGLLGGSRLDSSQTTDKQPSEVFTPRAAAVNEAMYVQRKSLEIRLIDAIGTNRYLVLHGESGNGKTWLYKRVFSTNDVHFEVINLSRVPLAGSLDNVFKQKLGEFQTKVLSSVDNVASAALNVLVAKGDIVEKISQQYYAESSVLTLFKQIRLMAGPRKPS